MTKEEFEAHIFLLGFTKTTFIDTTYIEYNNNKDIRIKVRINDSPIRSNLNKTYINIYKNGILKSEEFLYTQNPNLFNKILEWVIHYLKQE